jgi:hypothetical protein
LNATFAKNIANSGKMLEVTVMTAEIITNEDTFLISLNDESNKLQIKSIIKDMLGFAEQLIVNNEGAYRKITSLYRQAREWKKSIEGKRKELTEPLRKQTSAINDKAKELTDPLDAVIALANRKTSGYQIMLEEIKRKEDEKIRNGAALFDAEDEIYIPPMEKVMRGDGAMAITKVEKRFKVVDLSKVPLKYLMIDAISIEQDIKLGINEISGISIYEEQTTQLRVR